MSWPRALPVKLPSCRADLSRRVKHRLSGRKRPRPADDKKLGDREEVAEHD